MKTIDSILIIDDDEVNNFICTRIIEKSEMTKNLITYTSAREGLEFLEKQSQDGGQFPDLILLDLNMPVMSGWEFLEEYKAFSGSVSKDVVLIVFSSSVYQDDIDRARSYSDVSDYRSKPITMDVLRDIREKYFS